MGEITLVQIMNSGKSQLNDNQNPTSLQVSNKLTVVKKQYLA